jgi:hypothetical protein
VLPKLGMAKAGDEKGLETELHDAEEVDAHWSASKLTGLGFVTFVVAVAIIVFMATRMTTCMYLDGSQ